jgi:hypothetical protein
MTERYSSQGGPSDKVAASAGQTVQVSSFGRESTDCMRMPHSDSSLLRWYCQEAAQVSLRQTTAKVRVINCG